MSYQPAHSLKAEGLGADLDEQVALEVERLRKRSDAKKLKMIEELQAEVVTVMALFELPSNHNYYYCIEFHASIDVNAIIADIEARGHLCGYRTGFWGVHRRQPNGSWKTFSNLIIYRKGYVPWTCNLL